MRTASIPAIPEVLQLLFEIGRALFQELREIRRIRRRVHPFRNQYKQSGDVCRS